MRKTVFIYPFIMSIIAAFAVGCESEQPGEQTEYRTDMYYQPSFKPQEDPRPRVAGTVRQIEKQLVRDGFVLRYETERVDDGLPPGEGVFLACSFWLADTYKLMGRDFEAKQLLQRLMQLQNDVGLLSEEYHLGEKLLVGNFPQAFSHVALVNTIINLHTQHGPAKQRSGASGHGPSDASAHTSTNPK